MMYRLLSSELRIQFSAGQVWQRNRGNIGISPQPLVGSPRRGCRTKGLDPARRGMPYLPLTEFFCPFNDHSPPTGRQGDLLATSRPSPPVLPPRVEMPGIEDINAAHVGTSVIDLVLAVLVRGQCQCPIRIVLAEVVEPTPADVVDLQQRWCATGWEAMREAMWAQFLQKTQNPLHLIAPYHKIRFTCILDT